MKKAIKEVGELMEQKEEINKKNKEFNIAFSMLDEKAQERALILLRALHLEQITKVNWVSDQIEEGSY